MKGPLVAIASVVVAGACAREPSPPTTAPSPTPTAATSPTAARATTTTATAAASPTATAYAADTTDPALAAIRQRGLDAMSRDCGECHEGHRTTAKPPALAAFDLDKPDWLSRFDDRRWAAALGRFNSKPAADRDAFVAFRDAELAARKR